MRTRQRLSVQRMPRPAASAELLEFIDVLKQEVLEGRIDSFAMVAAGRDADGDRAVLRQWNIPDNTSFFDIIGQIRVLEMRLCEEQRIREGTGIMFEPAGGE